MAGRDEDQQSVLSFCIRLEEISVDVIVKPIRNMYLKVHAPEGRVSLSVPVGMEDNEVRSFALSRLGWIRRSREKVQSQPRDVALFYRNGEEQFLWGKPCLLEVCEFAGAPGVCLKGRRIYLQVRPGTDARGREAVMAGWMRKQLLTKALFLVRKWEIRMGVRVEKVYIRRMKTRWGSCNCRAFRVRLNTELVRRPVSVLEYVVVHELAHLLEPSHNDRFRRLMDTFLPEWRSLKESLNHPPSGGGLNPFGPKKGSQKEQE
ncbi:M48 family metallopeptidase [Desulfobotulus sp. H1]|uniref:M48 family metallopeptidase n=1 Tax=Desulfobotulus pelophilus TaxID=2823377 RepID=A0ABT3N833_9BACT|nr:SprT family zinc-dependent metalloprotease [Desulfobotulus pelophilus]MCW7753614.1 M48 family metallopeptidase [Desulfobotulus pelophilus]